VRWVVSGLLVATLALCGCSPSVPSWAMAARKSQWMAQHSHLKKIHVAPITAHPKAISDGAHIGSAPSDYEDREPFSERWHQDQEIEQRRIDSLLILCRGC
jgi:hypothetical protein